jgi:hypoxanthine phosphoribosyltransferase
MDSSVRMSDTVTMHGKTFEVFLTDEEIQQRVWELGQEISKDYKGKIPLILSILNGSFIFTADLIRYLDVQLKVEFVRLASYVGTSSAGEILEILGLRNDIKGEDVIIVEDIVDTGLTLSKFVAQIKEKNPNSVKVVSLLQKPAAIEHPVDIDYVGFEIPNEFVLGYGLDFDEIGRELPQIYKLVE